MNCFVIPVVIGATGIVTEQLKEVSGNNTWQAFNRLFGKKTAVLGASHIIRKVTRSENWKPE
jgi:hypothetical protein